MCIRKYMNDISKLPKISKEKEASLLKIYEDSKVLDCDGNIISQDISLRNTLVTNNLKLIFKVAKSYNRSGIPFADLISEGNLGLIRGIEKYNLDKGVKLGYYLYKWIRAYILRYIVRNAHLVKIGTTQGQRKLFFNLAKTKSKATALQYDMTDEDIAATLGVKVEEVREMDQRLSAPIIRIEAYDTDDKSAVRQNGINRLLYERVDNQTEDLPDQAYENEEKRKLLQQAVSEFVNRLEDRERDIFKARFLSDVDDQETLEELGKRWGTPESPLTKQRIQQIDAMLKLRFKKYLTHNQIMSQL